MSNIDKRALREAAVRAGGVKWQYMRVTQHTKAYLTDEKGWTVVNCTDGDVPAKCAVFIESANPATVLALLDELEVKDKAWTAQDNHINQQADRIESLEKKNGELGRALGAAQKRIAELEAREVTLPPTFWYEHDDLSREVPVLDKRLVKKAIRAAGIRINGEG